MKDRIAVLAVLYTSLGKDDRDEVDAALTKERNGGGVREELGDESQHNLLREVRK